MTRKMAKDVRSYFNVKVTSRKMSRRKTVIYL